MAKDSDDRDTRKRVRKQWPREINYPEDSHPIYSKPTVIDFGLRSTKSTSASGPSLVPDNPTSDVPASPSPKPSDTTGKSQEDTMAQDNGEGSTPRRLRKAWSPVVNFPEDSHPIFSKPIVMAFKNNPTPPTAEPEKSSEASEEAQPPRRYPKHKPVPMKFRDASDPIYSNPTVLGFVRSRKRSSPDSEIPDKPSSASPEDSEEKVD